MRKASVLTWALASPGNPDYIKGLAMRRTGLRILGRSALAILTWLWAGLCLVQMSACSEHDATQPVPGTKPATTQPVPVRTMSATIRTNGDGRPQRVYWRAPDQEVIRYTDENFVLLNATGHPNSTLHGDVFGGGVRVNVISTLFFAAQPPQYIGPDMFRDRMNLEHLRDMDFPRMTANGTEVVDGARLLCYEVPYGITMTSTEGFHTTIWADPQTKRAVRFSESSRRGAPPMVVEYSDIKFDEPLDDSLFCWPTLADKSVEQEVRIAPPPDVTPKTLKISLESPEGRQLVIAGPDVQPVMVGYGRDPVLAKNFMQITRGCVGKRLRVTLNDLPAQELEVVGVISGLQVIYPH